MCLHASWLPAERCTRCTPLPRKILLNRVNADHYTPRSGLRPRAYCTDIIQHDLDTSARFDAMLERDGPHLIFRTTRRHFPCITQYGDTIISCLRFAYSRAFPHDPVQVNEIVRVTCGHVGHEHTGDGYCVEPSHLSKIRINEGAHE